MDRNQAKSSQKPPKERGLYTPESVRERVVQRHVKGESKRRIAREEGIDRETVNRILSQEEVVKLMAEYSSRLLEMVPKALRVFDKALDSDDARVATGAATKLLEVMRLQKGDIEQSIRAANPQPEVKFFLYSGSYAQHVWDEYRRGEPLPPGYEFMANLKESEIVETERDGGPVNDYQDSGTDNPL